MRFFYGSNLIPQTFLWINLVNCYKSGNIIKNFDGIITVLNKHKNVLKSKEVVAVLSKMIFMR